MLTSKKIILAALTASSLISGCIEDTDIQETGESTGENVNYTDLNATSGAKVYLDLTSAHTVTENENWHISYQKYIGFNLNGGISGSGSVMGCLAQEYPALYNGNGAPVVAEFEKLTAENTLADFNAIDINSCTTMVEDSVNTYITMDDWLEASYGPSGPSFSAKANSSNGWIISSATLDGTQAPEAYGRVRVSEVTYTSNPATRQLKFGVELWNAGTQAFDAESITTNAIDFSTGKAYWDMETNTKVTSTDNWELSIEAVGQSWNIQVNSGISGSGHAMVGLVILPSGHANDVLDPTDTSEVYRFFSDSVAGALSSPANFGPLHYNVYGTHDMTPTFAHYLIQDAGRTFKVQVLNNYGENGDQASGKLYIRYEEL